MFPVPPIHRYNAQWREARLDETPSSPATEPVRAAVSPPVLRLVRVAPQSAMHPDDIATHRANRVRREKRALAASVRLALLRATGNQGVVLLHLTEAVEHGKLEPAEARSRVADIRRQQAKAA